MTFILYAFGARGVPAFGTGGVSAFGARGVPAFGEGGGGSEFGAVGGANQCRKVVAYFSSLFWCPLGIRLLYQ